MITNDIKYINPTTHTHALTVRMRDPSSGVVAFAKV